MRYEVTIVYKNNSIKKVFCNSIQYTNIKPLNNE